MCALNGLSEWPCCCNLYYMLFPACIRQIWQHEAVLSMSGGLQLSTLLFHVADPNSNSLSLLASLHGLCKHAVLLLQDRPEPPQQAGAGEAGGTGGGRAVV